MIIIKDEIKILLILLAVFAGSALLGVALGVITLPWHSVTAQVDSSHSIIDKTYDPAAVMANYEWFKQTYEDIEATQNKINNVQDQMDDFVKLNGNDTSKWDYQTKESYQQMQVTLTGLKNYGEDLTAQYKARSSMANREIFKDGLPMNVDIVLRKTAI